VHAHESIERSSHHRHERDTLDEPACGIAGTASPSLRILAIDVGAGTQDVLIYESGREPENCVKLVLPSQTQVLAKRIRRTTQARRPVHLTGHLMGGGAVADAARDHLAAGLPLTASPAAARTLHNDLERVRAWGVTVTEEEPRDGVRVVLSDVDWFELAHGLRPFEVELPDVVAVAVQDHGYRPGSGNNEVRFDYLQGLLQDGGDLARMVYREPPPEMTRMVAVARSLPRHVTTYVMDTGAAAVLGALGDPVVARAVESSGAILVNVGNMHTFAVLVRGRRLFGLFEHHTGGMTTELIGALVERLRGGTIEPERFRRDFDGHGAALDPAYERVGPFPFVAVTGPNRRLARPLGYHEAAPHGDMMLTGAFGLVEGVLLAMAAGGTDHGLSLVARS
jgi:uncharacterized protein (DUF1786 family)